MAKNKKPFHETINDYRVFPRLFGFIFMGMMIFSGVMMFFLEAPTPEQAAYASAVLAACAAFARFYVNSGPKKGRVVYLSEPNEKPKVMDTYE